MHKLQPSSAAALLLLCLVLTTNCLQAQTTPTLLLVNGKIWTVDPARPEVEAIAITNNRIAAVGSNEEISSWKRPGVPVIDLEGRRVLPGFNDAHVHFFGSSALSMTPIRWVGIPASWSVIQYSRARWVQFLPFCSAFPNVSRFSFT
jgi:hypothetical protein